MSYLVIKRNLIAFLSVVFTFFLLQNIENSSKYLIIAVQGLFLVSINISSSTAYATELIGVILCWNFLIIMKSVIQDCMATSDTTGVQWIE